MVSSPDPLVRDYGQQMRQCPRCLLTYAVVLEKEQPPPCPECGEPDDPFDSGVFHSESGDYPIVR